MPEGMKLKSDGFASSLSAPADDSTLKAYCEHRDIPYHDTDLPVPLDVFNAYDQAAEAGEESAAVDWLPGSVLLDALRAAGLECTAEKLGALVVRTAEEKRTKKEWEGSRVNGYPLAAVARTVQAKYGLTA